MLNNGGVLAGAGRRLADRRHLRVSAGIADRRSTTTCSSTATSTTSRRSKPEIALNPTARSTRRSTGSTSRASSGIRRRRRPASRRGRSRSRSTACAGPGLTYVNMNVVRNFQLGGRRTLQARIDIQNLLNYAAYNNPSHRSDEHQFRQGDDGGGFRRRDAVLQLRDAVHVSRTDDNPNVPTPSTALRMLSRNSSI